ncbi:MAG: CBS domain-containing protein [Candidatus Aenigmatarchaeota archaeon]
MMIVKDIMSKNVICLSPEDTVSELISLVEKNHIREIPIVENKKLKGIVYSKDIARKNVTNPQKTKIAKVVKSHPATVSPDQDINEAAELILKNGLIGLPVVEKGKVVGIISMHDIINFSSKTKQFRQTKAEQIMSMPETITNDVDIGKARLLMREKNISRLPVVDSKNKLSGVVTIFDLLKAVKPRDRMGFYSKAAEKETMMGIPVSTIMDRNPVTAERSNSLNEIVSLIDKNRTDGIIVLEGGQPIGVVTEKDLLEVYVSSFKQKGIFYQISGLKDEDDFILATVNRMIRDSLQKLTKMTKSEFFFLHVKRYDKKGKVKYSIRTRLMTERGIFVSKSYAWDLREAVDMSLDRLEKIIIRGKEHKKDKIEDMLRFKKLLR